MSAPPPGGVDRVVGRPGVSVVVLAHGHEELLEECLTSVEASTGVQVEVVLVDNGCTSGAVDALEQRPSLTVLRPGTNTGFAGGAHLGARHSHADVLAFVNSDAVVHPSALRELVDALQSPDVGIVCAGVRLMDQPDLVNSAGNPVHYLGLSWAGGLGDPVSAHDRRGPVASASGCVMAVRRDTWLALGGFFEPMFAYHEDVELSLRCWQRGWTVEHVPAAVAWHAYAFHRNPTKMYLLERNRLLTLLTVLERRTLALVAVPALALEVAVLLLAVRQGWWRQKLQGWWWLARHLRLVRTRRRDVQAVRTRGDDVLLPLLSARFDAGVEGFVAPRLLDAVSATYWRLARRALR